MTAGKEKSRELEEGETILGSYLQILRSSYSAMSVSEQDSLAQNFYLVIAGGMAVIALSTCGTDLPRHMMSLIGLPALIALYFMVSRSKW
ncbi:MAG TPA: hypothetical protein PLY72_20785 [Candidatus Obscuribacter sp.]|nr:hypothetical protein [Candidatus Obscuribacter sp.]